MNKTLVMVTLLLSAYAGKAYGLATTCVADDNWMNRITSETYTYQQYADNPVQNIAGDSIALNMDVLGVLGDGTVQPGDQVRFTVNNGAVFAENVIPMAAPGPVIEEDLGGAGTGNLSIGSLIESSPFGGNTLTFTLVPENFIDGPDFSTRPFDYPVPCDPNNYNFGEGVILSGSGISGQAVNFRFAPEPWVEPDVTMRIEYFRNGNLLFSGEQVLFSVSDWVPLTVPDAPVIGTASAGNAMATVAFSAPANDGGTPITGYTATSAPGNLTGTCASSPCSVTGLTNGTSYTFSVVATNAQGDSLPSQPSNAVTPVTVPGAPIIGVASAGNGQASIPFTPPASNGGSPITGYTATSAPGDLTGTCASSPCSVAGLTNGTSYTFTVTASNAQGNGPASQPSNAVIPATVPGAPTIGLATAGDGQASVAFTAPSDTGGSSVSSYRATSTPGNLTGTCTSSPCTVTGLSNGTAYTFSIVASNARGDGPPSQQSNAVTPAGLPGVPGQIQVRAVPRGLSVSWTAPTDNGGSPILRYRAEANPSCEVAALPNEVPGVTQYACTIGALDPSRTYTVTLTAISAAGQSSVIAAPGIQPLAATAVAVPALGSWATWLLALLTIGLCLPALQRTLAR